MLLQPPLRQDDRSVAYDATVARLQSLDLAVLAIYDIDNVAEGALTALAEQLNVQGLRGWALTTTEEQRRELLKEAVALHQTAGTPYAVKRAMALVGYPNASIAENPGNFYDGDWTYNGNRQYDGAELGAFIVTLDATQSAVSSELITLIVALINEWKNARSYLLDLRIGNVSLFSNLLQYSDTWSYDGAQTYDGQRNL